MNQRPLTLLDRNDLDKAAKNLTVNPSTLMLATMQLAEEVTCSLVQGQFWFVVKRMNLAQEFQF